MGTSDVTVDLTTGIACVETLLQQLTRVTAPHANKFAAFASNSQRRRNAYVMLLERGSIEHVYYKRVFTKYSYSGINESFSSI